MKHELTAKRLQIAMSNMNINAQELSNRSGVAKASISQYVNGSHKPSNISSGKMASVLKVNPLWLMGFDVPMQAEEQHKPNLKPGIQVIHADGTVETFDISSLVYSIMESVSEMPPEQQEMVNNMVGGNVQPKKKHVIYVTNPQNSKRAGQETPSHLLPNAARTSTDVPAEEDVQFDEDIMDDDNF